MIYEKRVTYFYTMSLKNIIYILFLFISVISYSQKCIVKASSGLNVREEPNLDSKKVGKLTLNQTVSIIEGSNNILKVEDEGNTIEGYWVKVKSDNGISGYVFEGYLELVDKFDKELLDFFNNESFEMIEKRDGKWVHHMSCYHNFTYEIKDRMLHRGLPQDYFSVRISSIKKIDNDTFVIKLLEGNDPIYVNILDKDKKIIEIEERRFVPESIFQTYEKIETRDGCYD